MNWKEFKQYVDKQIKNKKINPDLKIEFIDVSLPDNCNNDEHGGFEVRTDGRYLWIGH